MKSPKRIFRYIFLATSLLVTISCSEKSDPTFDAANFSKVYDNFQFKIGYDPVDIVQTADGGYLIVGEARDTTRRSLYILKADKYGNFEKDLEDEHYMNPVAQLMKINDNYYFFCMADPVSTQLVQVDQTLANVQMIPVSNNLDYPAASARNDDNSFIVLNYDQDKRQFVVSLVDVTGNASKSARFDIEASDEIEGPIVNHFHHQGTQFPFFVGKTPSGLYYFNAFYNYNLSLVFTDLSKDNKVNGVTQGQRGYSDGGISAFLPNSNPADAGKYHIARFNFGDNYFLPATLFDPAQIISSADYPAFSNGKLLPELVPDAAVKIIRATILNKNVVIYASNTRSKQIGLFFYDESTGAFLGSRYFGFSNPYEIGNLIQTDDGGLAICGTTYVAGRFSRICLFKVSKDELSKGLNLNSSN